MATVQDIVTRALRKIGVIAKDVDASADDMAEGVDALNAMIHAWELRGVDLDWTDQTSADTFALDAPYHEGVVYLLASRIAPDYEIPQSFDADDWFRGFQAANMTISEAAMPLALRKMPGQYVNPKRARSFGS